MNKQFECLYSWRWCYAKRREFLCNRFVIRNDAIIFNILQSKWGFFFVRRFKNVFDCRFSWKSRSFAPVISFFSARLELVCLNNCVKAPSIFLAGDNYLDNERGIVKHSFLNGCLFCFISSSWRMFFMLDYDKDNHFHSNKLSQQRLHKNTKNSNARTNYARFRWKWAWKTREGAFISQTHLYNIYLHSNAAQIWMWWIFSKHTHPHDSAPNSMFIYYSISISQFQPIFSLCYL